LRTLAICFGSILFLLKAPLGLAKSLTFNQALELAEQHTFAQKGVSLFSAYDTCETAATNLQSQNAFVNSSLVNPPNFPPFLKPTSQPLLNKLVQSSVGPLEGGNVIRGLSLAVADNRRLCAALIFEDLVKLNAEIRVLDDQELNSVRLTEIESRRVDEKIDTSIVLMRAKLLRARTALWAVSLKHSARILRAQLADITGLSAGEVDVDADSMPALPYVKTRIPELQLSMDQLAAIREMAQLEYAIARGERMRIRANTILAKASLGDLIAAYIVEDEKFIVVLDANCAFQKAQLRTLQANGELEKWAFQTQVSAHDYLQGQEETPDCEPTINSATKSVMLTPAVGSLLVGQAQQFSAIAVFRNGTAKDESSQTVWRSSDNFKAIISRSGFATFLASGQIDIIVTFCGVSKSRRLRISADSREPFSELLKHPVGAP
jgi:Bacterial Ig-like domain (group 2)